MKNALLENITISFVNDDTDSLDYLDQYADSTDPEEIKYYEQDQKRKRDHGNTWVMYGIRATGQILIPDEAGTSFTIITIDSHGLWGIESDSDKSYFKEVAADQIEELKYLLSVLNVDITGGTAIFAGSKSEKTLLSFEALTEQALNKI